MATVILMFKHAISEACCFHKYRGPCGHGNMCCPHVPFFNTVQRWTMQHTKILQPKYMMTLGFRVCTGLKTVSELEESLFTLHIAWYAYTFVCFICMHVCLLCSGGYSYLGVQGYHTFAAAHHTLTHLT